MSSEFDGIELADAIQSIRDQLLEAAALGTGQPLDFEVGDIQMEFTLELRKEVKGGTKVKAWVVEAGADGTRTTGHTHKVAFTLKPVAAESSGPFKVGNPRTADISGFGRGAQ
ncbi:trypco2 family protein [Streptomyces sp. MUM 178J]|uniref:trypco2 family protein n=1 Tax=Streptomyces sp. MUM 178J TaxID=2791991 RepID=UPI001F03DD2B|nr:trypco2 family protein [Streptomyces sp. MUM 178J]WRQ82102.1 trypco2 family protein [Streptomyces sp. MUM 178J]